MVKVGLTGGIGTGKSTVSSMFKQRNIPIIDADVIAREVLNIYPEIIKNINLAFGKEFIDEDGQLKRREFGNYIFQDEKKRKKFENIIIPFIKKEIFLRFKEYDLKGEKIVILDAPTLIENGLDKEMDFNILVWADKEVQLKRVKIRDKLTDAEALNRIKSQMPLDEKIKLVDYIINNAGSLENTEAQIDRVLNDFV